MGNAVKEAAEWIVLVVVVGGMLVVGLRLRLDRADAPAWQVWLFWTASGGVLFGLGGLALFGPNGSGILTGFILGALAGAGAGILMITPIGRGLLAPRKPRRPGRGTR